MTASSAQRNSHLPPLSDPPTRQKSLHPIRVLFIVDSLYWVIGNFAQQIRKHNPAIQTVICSQFAIRKTIKRFGHFPTCFNVVHFLRTKTIPEFWGNFPIVTTLHHFDPATNLAPLYQSDAVMTVSSQWQRYLIERGIPESYQTLVPFGVDTNIFCPSQAETRMKIRKDLNFSKHAFVLGFSSRRASNTDDRKGVTCFLQALKELRQQLPNLATLIIGPGWQELAKGIRRQGISCAQVPYEITHEHVAKFYNAMDVFWVTSRVEGGPVPLLEAMASGIPCISTPVGAALDRINHNKNGFIVSFDSPGQFVDQSLQLAHNEALRIWIGNEARKTIEQNNQWGQVGGRLQELYALAIKNFHANSNRSFTQNQTKNVAHSDKQKVARQNTMSEQVFFSKTVQNWIQTCEQMNGLRMMVEMREWKTVGRLGYKALRTIPFHPSLWRELIGIATKSLKATPPRASYQQPPAGLTPKQPL